MEQPLQDLKDKYDQKIDEIKSDLYLIYQSWIEINRPDDYDYLLSYYINKVETQNDNFLNKQVTSYLIQISDLLGIPM